MVRQVKLAKLVILFLLGASILQAQSPPPQAAGYHLAWEDTFSVLNLCYVNTALCNWYNPGKWSSSTLGTVTDPYGTYVDVNWQSSQIYPTNIGTAASNAAYYHAWLYGYVEISMAFNPVTGSWPILWMLPVSTIGQSQSQGGEIDLFEWQSQVPTAPAGSVHVWLNGTDIGNNDTTNTWTIPGGTNFANFNTYGVLWTPTAISWYFNNSLMESFSITASPFSTAFNSPFFVLLSQAAGCNWTFSYVTPCAGQVSPLDLQVQWVHVFQPGSAVNGGALSGGVLR